MANFLLLDILFSSSPAPHLFFKKGKTRITGSEQHQTPLAPKKRPAAQKARISLARPLKDLPNSGTLFPSWPTLGKSLMGSQWHR